MNDQYKDLKRLLYSVSNKLRKKNQTVFDYHGISDRNRPVIARIDRLKIF